MKLFFFTLLFSTSLQIASAQLNLTDSLSWLIDSTKNETYDFQYKSYQRALVLAQKTQLSEQETKAQIRLATTLSYLGKHVEALERFREAEILIEQHGFPHLKSLLYLKKSGVLVRLNHIDEAIEYNEEAAKWFAQKKDTINLGLTYGNIGGLHYNLREFETAESYLEKALFTLIGTKNENDGMILSNLAGIYLQKGQVDRAIPLYETYLVETRKNNSIIHEVAILGNLGYAYGAIKNYQKSFSYYENALQLADEGNFLDAKHQALRLMSHTYEDKGDYKNALEYHRKYKEVQEEVIGKKTQDKVAELKVKYETVSKENELISLKQEAKIKMQRYLLLTSILLAFIIIGLLAYFKSSSDFKKNKALYLAQKNLMEIELKHKSLEEQRLQERLEYQNKDLTNLTLDITRKNEFSNQLISKLNNLDKNISSSQKGELNSIKLFVSNNLRINEELEVFQKSIEEVNQDFYSKLLKHFPNLTAKDTELCGLIKLNHSNKEIAVLKNISVSSSKMKRYRLRKKLNLQGEDDIVNFLRNLS